MENSIEDTFIKVPGVTVPIKTEEKRNPDGTFVVGNPGGPGRPKGKTLKEYKAEKFRQMSDEEKEQWILDNKISGIDAWKMAEGNPKQDVEADVKAVINVTVLPEVAKAFGINATNTETSGSDLQQV